MKSFRDLVTIGTILPMLLATGAARAASSVPEEGRASASAALRVAQAAPAPEDQRRLRRPPEGAAPGARPSAPARPTTPRANERPPAPAAGAAPVRPVKPSAAPAGAPGATVRPATTQRPPAAARPERTTVPGAAVPGAAAPRDVEKRRRDPAAGQPGLAGPAPRAPTAPTAPKVRAPVAPTVAPPAGAIARPPVGAEKVRPERVVPSAPTGTRPVAPTVGTRPATPPAAVPGVPVTPPSVAAPGTPAAPGGAAPAVGVPPTVPPQGAVPSRPPVPPAAGTRPVQPPVAVPGAPVVPPSAAVPGAPAVPGRPAPGVGAPPTVPPQGALPPRAPVPPQVGAPPATGMRPMPPRPEAGHPPRDGERRGGNDVGTALGAAAVGVAVGVVGGMILGGEARALDDVHRQRREEMRDGSTYYAEPGRVIIRDGNGLYMRHDETERFRAFGGRNYDERRGDDYVKVWERPDGVRIVTVTDADGRLLRRIRRWPDGREEILIDNAFRPRPRDRREEVVVVPPPPVPGSRWYVDAERSDETVIWDTLRAPPLAPLPRRYTLDEVRSSRDLRSYMPAVDVDTITFDSGSWTVEPSQISRLDTIARSISKILTANSEEIFLVEGHTDAVGPDVDNMSLSDRRAQSVATVLTQTFGIPAENLVTQGYGEQVLKEATEGPSRVNRRVTVRRITPLLGTASSR